MQSETRCVRDCQRIKEFRGMIHIQYCREQGKQGQSHPESLLPGVKATLAQLINRFVPEGSALKTVDTIGGGANGAERLKPSKIQPIYK